MKLAINTLMLHVKSMQHKRGSPEYINNLRIDLRIKAIAQIVSSYFHIIIPDGVGIKFVHRQLCPKEKLTKYYVRCYRN